MGWNAPNPIYCYPRRKRRKYCDRCKYYDSGRCYQRTYHEYSYAELEGSTTVKCSYFKKATKKEQEKLRQERINKLDREIAQSSCCIIMCVLGTGYYYKLNTVRKWRDTSLKNNFLGRAFIKFYYNKFSPFMIRLIQNKVFLKRIIKYNILFFIKILELRYSSLKQKV